MKRYLRMDIEYDTDESSKIRMTANNIAIILAEDMPYCKILFTRDTSIREHLDNERYKG